MPTYEYRRQDGTVFEFWQKMSDSPIETCPTTGQLVSRVISGGSGVVYKGEGWYVTDYKNAGKKSSCSEKPENGCACQPAQDAAPASANSAPN